MFDKIKQFFSKKPKDKALAVPYQIEQPTEIIIAPSGSWMYASPVILVDPAKVTQIRTSKPAIIEPPRFTRSQ